MSETRLDSLTVENFRSISGRWTVPLDADVVLVHGPNGSGKTSLLSAIELGATGGVSFLDADSSLHEVLLNHNYPIGGVQLRVRSADGHARHGAINLDSHGLAGEGALDAAERIYFSERCFLPQTALGRLLETYTTTGRQVDTALVRFVKTVVGLDDLDGLIEGLRAAGHVARTKAASAAWQRAEREQKAAQERQRAVKARLAEAMEAEHDAANTLRRILGARADNVPDTDLATLVSTPWPEPANQHGDLEAIRLRLEGIREALRPDVHDSTSQADAAAQEAVAAERARTAYEDWEMGEGARALGALNQLRQEHFSLSPVAPAQFFDSYDDAQHRLIELMTARAEAVQRRVLSEELRVDLSRQLEAATAEMLAAQAAAAAIAVPEDVRVLLEILEKTIPRVNGNTCPVCDEEFSGQGTSLRQHLEVKAASLSENANLLMEAHGQLERARVNRTAAEARLRSAPLPTEPVDEPVQLTRQLNALEESVAAGRSRLEELRRMETRLAEVAARRARLDVAERSLQEIRPELGVPEGTFGVGAEVERLLEIVEQRSQEESYETLRRHREMEAAETLEARRATVLELQRQSVQLESELEVATRVIREAEARKKAANQLRVDAERVRSRVINQVFDKTLNSLWADLFSRFVPSEPYLPRFRKQRQSNRSVDIHLETVLPNGDSSGSPSSMLSYGNTNTAALSLFIALHLSGPSRLPWLIFDDPVQSMDDIHVSNFATVVRQLSFAHKRQVVIAVHQQELFDYLALELAPPTANESLLKVRLDRRGVTSFVEVERVNHTPERALATPPPFHEMG